MTYDYPGRADESTRRLHAAQREAHCIKAARAMEEAREKRESAMADSSDARAAFSAVPEGAPEEERSAALKAMVATHETACGTWVDLGAAEREVMLAKQNLAEQHPIPQPDTSPRQDNAQ